MAVLRFSAMAKRPTRIDLLELDIDLRLADLWREAGEISEWTRLTPEQLDFWRERIVERSPEDRGEILN